MRGVDSSLGPSVTILHISDTQFGQYHRFDAADSLADGTVRDIAQMPSLDVPPIDLIIVSGDIAESGMSAEFDQARAFLDAICRHADLKPDRVVVVPGNHDVNWALSEAFFAECRGYGREPAPRTRRNGSTIDVSSQTCMARRRSPRSDPTGCTASTTCRWRSRR